MLILTRKVGQSFTIGDDIEITITEIQGDKVRVGIEAPKQVKVLRSELRETAAENLHAAGVADADAVRALAEGLRGGTAKSDAGPTMPAATPVHGAAKENGPIKGPEQAGGKPGKA